MNQTVVGVFNSYEDAQSAAAELGREGFDRGDIQIKAGSTGTASSTTTGYRDSEEEGTGVMASIRHFFAELFGDDDNAGTYAEAVRRGRAVVTVDADEDRLDRAREILSRCGAVDIDEQATQWRSEGWTGYDEDGIATAREQRVGSAGVESRTTASGRDRVAGEGEEVLPVVQEELEIGKRRVSGGVVRVVSRVVSQPVTESVDLRSEEAVIERRPVDRPATEADLAGFQERTIEVAEMSEKAVVNKTARVVEEVVVGKQVHHDTQSVEDSVRRTEVDVERTGSEDRGAGGGMGRASGTMASVGSSGSMGGATVTGATTTMGDGGSVGGGMRSGRGAFSDYEDEFRQDWQTTYGSAGGRYEDYQPAYRSGYELRGDSQFANSRWEEAEPRIRERWERDNPGSAWERFKAAVRRGWDRATS